MSQPTNPQWGAPQPQLPQGQPQLPQGQWGMPPLPPVPPQYYQQQPVQQPSWKQSPVVQAIIGHAKRAYSRIGAGMALTMVVWVLLVACMGMIARTVYAGGVVPSWLTIVINDVVLYCIAIPIGYVLLKSVPEEPTHAYRLKPGRFFALLLMCFPLMYGGSILGTLFSSLFSGGTSSNRMEDITGGNSVVINVIALVILAPLVEEWLFRKQLISRLRRFGEKPAILMSALMFALFHMNFYQFFYAFALGLMFGYVYTRTSMLRYSTLMHMIINTIGGVISPAILDYAITKGGVDSVGEPTPSQLTAIFTLLIYIVVLLIIAVTGLVLLIVQRKKFVFYDTPEQLPKGTVRESIFGNGGCITYIIISGLLTVLYLFM